MPGMSLRADPEQLLWPSVLDFPLMLRVNLPVDRILFPLHLPLLLIVVVFIAVIVINGSLY